MPRKENPISCPQLQQLDSWPQGRNSRYPATPGKLWEISSPAKNSLSWSIVLAYVLNMKENSQQKFQLLLGNESEIKKWKVSDLEAIRNNITRFNPFKNRHSFYSNTNNNVQKLRKNFDLSMNRFAYSIKKDVAWGNTRKLEGASRMLKCRIRVYETDQAGNKTYRTFPEEQHAPCEYGEIIIFQHSGMAITENIDDTFAFGMSEHHALSLRKEALRYILQTAKLQLKSIDIIMNDFEIDENFLYFLLKTLNYDLVPILYKSPYIPLKLAEAGFNTNPLCLEKPNGPSVFNYCMLPDAYYALIILYDYASNNCYRTSETTRNPGEDILLALENISLVLKCYRVPSSLDSICGSISSFNEYQYNVVKYILELEDSELKSKKIVCRNLEYYEKYFSLKQKPYSYATFVQYSCYYENLDSFTCLQFFDVFLKLSNSDDLMETVISLFLTIFSYNYLPKCNHVIKNTACKFDKDVCWLRFVPFHYRKIFLENAKLLVNSLNTSEASTVDTKGTIESLRQKLGRYPEIKDQFSVSRLIVNMKSALEVSLEDNGIRGMLTIERALQVLGETLCPPKGGECVLCCLLSACISQDITNHLISIRMDLSKSTPASVLGRFKIEPSLYKSLQISLKRLNELFEFVYFTQENRIILMLLEDISLEAQNVPNDIWKKIEYWKVCMTNDVKSQYEKRQEKYILLIDDVLNFLIQKLKRGDFKKAIKHGEIEALEFLYKYLPTCLEECNQIMKTIRANIGNNSVDLSENVRDELIRLLSQQSKIIEDKFGRIIHPLENSVLKNLQSFKEKIKSYPFSDEETKNIKIILKGILEKSSEAKIELRAALENNCISLLQLGDLTNKIVMTDQQRENISSTYQNNSKKALDILSKVKEVDIKILEKDLLGFLEREQVRKPMRLTHFPAPLGLKVENYLNRKVLFLIDKITHLKTILIEDDDEINKLWKWGRSKAIQKHMIFLMTQRYIKERHVRAPLEMLLFDCHNILVDRDDLKHLWTKANYLFTGVDIRDVLSHGNPVLQIAGGVLDAKDFPKELINKMLELIEDGEVIGAVLKMFEKKKPCNKQEFDREIENCSDFSVSTKEEMEKNNKKWNAYFGLFPLN